MSQIFVDELGREWTFRITIGLAEEVHKRCDRPDSTPENPKYYDLLSVVDTLQPQYFQPLLEGRVSLNYAEKLVNMFYVLLEKQCIERKVSQRDFAEMLLGGTFGKAIRAFQDELLNFIPVPEFSETVKAIMNNAGGMDKAALIEAARRLNTLEVARGAGISEVLDTRMKPFEEATLQDIERMKAEAIIDAQKAVEELSTTNS
jgi:hypothetical protein